MIYLLDVKKIEAVLTALLLGIFTVVLVHAALSVEKLPVTAANGPYCLVIDPGHGGFDGGAIAADGTRECDLNLKIALKLEKIADLAGVNTVLTRKDDSRKTDILSYSEHEDLVSRTKTINQVPNAVLISIHQNDYPTSQPSGAQVLYAQGEESCRLGKLTQDKLVRALQPENRRLAEAAPKKLYITSNVVCPAILVECGFLSNGNDLEKLQNDAYQTSFAAILFSSYLQFTAPKDFT